MKDKSEAKILTWNEASEAVKKWQAEGSKVVFTNGCFDILHMGHARYLDEAAGLGDKLIIGVNSDRSTRALKGDSRPINTAYARMYLLASLSSSDCVVEFDQETPLDLIAFLQPDILVKGGDYEINDIVGADLVQENGGSVVTIPFVKGYSTTSIEERIIAMHETSEKQNKKPEL